MDLSKNYEEIVNNSNGSFKCVVIDNDSGYISQNVESNSSIDISNDRQATLAVSNVKDIYVNEDTLFEKPQVLQKPLDNNYNANKEHDHLSCISNESDYSVMTSSAVSEDSTFSGLTNEQATSFNISNSIPIATPLKVLSSIDDVNTTQHVDEEESKIGYVNDAQENVDKTNFNEENFQTSFSLAQTPVIDANQYNISMYDSFYSFLCNLYTANDISSHTLVNPRDLEINHNQDNVSPQNSPKSYQQLETRSYSNVEINKEKVEAQKENIVLTPIKNYINPIEPYGSPELFSDEEQTKTVSKSLTQLKTVCEQLYITKNDHELLKRVQVSLCGVPPPPSVTINQISPTEMLQKIRNNQHLLFSSEPDSVSVYDEDLQKKKGSLLVMCKESDLESKKWPAIMRLRYHGLHYNRSKVSEDIEHLCFKYAQRYIGAETQSSCTVFGIQVSSPSKTKIKFKRTVKSPGKRLSHLAKRRITFSKDSLVGPSSNSVIGNRTRQIMVDARKFELLSRRKSPKKKSPRKTSGKSPRYKSKTPNSTSKKKAALNLHKHNTEDNLDSIISLSNCLKVTTTKKALFQSPPDKGECTNGLLELYGADTSNIAAKRTTPRRALFNSPLKISPLKSLYPKQKLTPPKRNLFKSPVKENISKSTEVVTKKRKRTDTDGDNLKKIAKVASSTLKDTSNELRESKPVSKHHSTELSQDVAEHRRKKLMWAVAEALRTKNIDMKHQNFKVFASILARVVRHFLPNLFAKGPRVEGRTSEAMLRIAQQHVFSVTRGKTVDQIIRETKAKLKVPKPTGYVGLNSVDSNISSGKNKENTFQTRSNFFDKLRSESEIKQLNLSRRTENIDRIRRVIDFGDEEQASTIR